MTTFTGSVSDFITGEIPDSTTMGYITDALQALSDAWSAYTPVWAASGTAVALGNGTITGAYIQVGKFVVAKFSLTMGSTTTYGTGNYTITSPVAMTGGAMIYGIGYAHDTSATTTYIGALQFATSSTTWYVRTHGATAQAGQTVPFTWANTDTLRGLAVYEAV